MGVAVGVVVGVGVGVGVPVTVGVGLGVSVPVADGVAVGVWVGVEVGAGDAGVARSRMQLFFLVGVRAVGVGEGRERRARVLLRVPRRRRAVGGACLRELMIPSVPPSTTLA